MARSFACYAESPHRQKPLGRSAVNVVGGLDCIGENALPHVCSCVGKSLTSNAVSAGSTDFTMGDLHLADFTMGNLHLA
ncbi:hypothetical protein ACLOJK_018247 [Asimina triloba]